jgi:CBS domain containing-hemolysin-like protein
VTEGIASWLGHPMTLVLAGLMLALLSATTEILLRSLAELGNVRFQGMLEDHERLLPVKGEEAPHLSRMLDVLRWQQIGAVGLLWLILVRFPGTTGAATMVLCVLTPVVLIILCRALIGPLSEDRTAVLLRLQRPLVWPSVALLAWLAPAPKLPPPEDEEEEASEREIQAYLEAGQAAGIFERDEGEFVESLVDFFDTVVREVMTPRTEMIAVPVEVALDEVMEVISETHKSRIPVYQETVDRVIGVVHVKNLVKQLTSDPQPSLAELAHQCMIVPESKELGELLREFQQHHQQMAIVVDEYGGTSGLVTLEDVLEKIVGEIQDEHEPSQPPEWQELSPGVYRLQGRAPLEVLEELFGVEVDEDDVDTVGGLVFSRHGTVPEAGTEVEDASLGLRFTVDEMRERRIVSVTVRQLEPADDADAEASAE